jgi:hypothetical protein
MIIKRYIFISVTAVTCLLAVYIMGFYIWIHQKNHKTNRIIVYDYRTYFQKLSWMLFRPITWLDETMNNHVYVSSDKGDKINFRHY